MQSLENHKNRRILVIDDNPSIHDDFRKILVSDGAGEALEDAEAAFFGEANDTGSQLEVELDTAHQGQEGLEKVVAAATENRPYALAFVDMRMPPGWDGLTTIEQLWKAEPDLQIVICTAYSDDSWSDICQRLGHTDQLLILKKPFDNTEVCQLALALTEKWNLTKQAQLKQDDLQQLVNVRTEVLTEVVDRLESEIEEKVRVQEELRGKDEQLRRSQKLQSIGTLAGGVAHEFNNLLQAIGGYTHYAMEDLGSADQRYQDLEQVLIATKRASELTRQLLGFSRRQTLKRSVVSPNDVISDLQKLIIPVLPENIEVEIKLAEQPASIYADAGELQQVLLNLCVNARDAMPDGGRLLLRTEDIVLDDQTCDQITNLPPGSYVMFTVTDTGGGMTAEVRDQIFDPFFTTKEVGKGTGLGLAMVYGIIKQHKGAIHVDSEPDQGTTFRVYLPAHDQPVEDDPEPTPETPATGTETILLAEDEPMVQNVAVRLLTKAGYNVIAARDGQEAIELFAEHSDSISLVLLDAVMPRMSGPEVYDYIKARKPETRIIFCTGYDRASRQMEESACAKEQLVEKPFSANLLLRTVRSVLDDESQDVVTATVA